MSEDNDSGAVENEDPSDSRLSLVGDEETGSSNRVEIPVNVEPVDVAAMDNTVTQETSSLLVDHVDLSNGALLTGDDSVEYVPSDVRAKEEGGKEEMFVDCPDELIPSDNKEAMAIPDTQESSVEKDDMQDTRAHESSNETREYKEDRDALLKELASLFHKLEALTGQHSLLDENTSLVGGFHGDEMGEIEKKISVSDNPLHDMMIECSNFVRSALDVRLQKEEKIRELEAMLSMKGQEIEDLHAKVSDEQHHVEAITDKVLTSLSMDVTEEKLLDDSFFGKMSRVEKKTSLLIEKYNQGLQNEEKIRELEAMLCMKGQDIEDLHAKVRDEQHHVEAVTDRVLASLAMEVPEEKLLDDSVSGKMSCVEKSTSLLFEKYNHSLYVRLQNEEKIKELEAMLSMKGQEIEDLHAKVSAEQHHVEAVTTRVLASLATAVTEEKLLDDSVTGKMSRVEENTSLLIEKYNHFLYGRLQNEEKIRELEATLSMKGQEIEDLHAKVSYEQHHAEAVTDKMLASLAMTVTEDKLLDDSVSGKMSRVEKNTSLLIEKYNHFLYEIYLLQQCLTEVGSDLSVQNDFGTTFCTTRDVLLELKRKEVDFVQKLSNLEDEKKKLVEQLDKGQEMADLAKRDVEKLRVELENEKTKYANTKEKLSLAVTKGKALVQQRDSLKQSLAEKTSELERCLTELQEKSTSLEAFELSKEESVRTEILASSLQEALSQRNTILARCEEILSETSVSHEFQTDDITERIRWLVDERTKLKDVTLRYDKLVDALSVIDLPENVSSSALESKVDWIMKSFIQANEEACRIQDEIARTSEAAQKEIESLTTLLLAETQEKIYLQEELNDLSHKYGEIVDKECNVSLEKDRMVSMLLDASGILMDCQEYGDQPSSDVSVLIERCICKFKEQSRVSEPSGLEAEVFERIQTLLYVKDQELMLCEKLLEEDILLRSKVNNLTHELRDVSAESVSLKDEKNAIQKDLERSEEKDALLREKLSIAVKKGKGLVQDRENLKNKLDERTTEIDKLKLELQQQESALGDCKDLISKLSTDVEVIPKLESDLTSMKDQKDQLEQFLLESNTLLQRVIESVDRIAIPINSTLEDPVEKVHRLAEYVNECQVAKMHVDQVLEKLKVEYAALSSEVAEACIAKKSLEEALSLADIDVCQLAEKKRELEVGKTHVEQELQKALEEATSQAGKIAEACSTRTLLEVALSESKGKISTLMNEKEEDRNCRASAEMELQIVKEEVLIQTAKLTEAYGTIKSLEYALSEAETNISLLTEKNNNVQVGRTNLENEIKKLKEEADSQSSKLADACSTIKLLEDALLKAENIVSELDGEKKNAREEILTLNTKLDACMEEMAGATGSLESRSLELSSHIDSLHLLLKDDTLLSLLKRSFELKFERLRDMDILLEDMKDHFVEMESETRQSCPAVTKEYSSLLKFSAGPDNIANGEMIKGQCNAEDGDSLEAYFGKTVKEFHFRNKILADNVEGFSACMDEFIAALLTKLQATRDGLMVKLDQIKSLKKKGNNLQMVRQDQETKIGVLENESMILLSACTDVIQELETEIENNPLEVSSVPDVREVSGDAVAEHQQRPDSSKYLMTSKNLSLAARKAVRLIKQFGNLRNASAGAIKELESKLTEIRASLENAIGERDLNQSRITKLNSDLEVLQKSYLEMSFQAEDCQAKQDKMNDTEAEISFLRNALLIKEKECEEASTSASQVKALYAKINDIEVPFAEFEIGDTDLHISDLAKKLFYIVDAVAPLRHHMNSLYHEKEELKSTLMKQVRDTEHLKEEVEQQILDKQEFEKMKNELFELEFALKSIIQKLKGNNLVGDLKFIGVRGLVSVLEKLVIAVILEYENSKSKAQELSAKLFGSQNVVDELSTKIKFLEDSKQSRSVSPEVTQETSISEAPSLPTLSEITEIEDVGPIAKKAAGPSASAAHVRTLRKGSNDHLAIDIDSESDRLMKNKETDEDKGHIFKSLNTSGLIPVQGKMIADRLDGIWVSGGRALTSRPRARLGIIAYLLFLHIWLLATL